MKIAVLLFAFVLYGSFIWAALGFFKTGNPGSRFGRNLVSILGGIAVLVCLGALADSDWHNVPQQWFGVALQSMSLGLFWWAVVSVRSQPLDFAFSNRQPVQLVSRGPYRYWRHPFYASYSFGWLSAALIAQSIWPLVVTVVMACLYLKAALAEERSFLASAMASEYRDYRSRAKLILPWIV